MIDGFKWFEPAIIKIADGTINLATDSFRAILLNASQVLTPAFTGHYGDLTGELATGSGYTNGGLDITDVSLTRSADRVTFTGESFGWDLESVTACKYLAIYDVDADDQDLLCYLDFNEGGGALMIPPGPLGIIPHENGIVGWYIEPDELVEP